jgi:hypothetical protein
MKPFERIPFFIQVGPLPVHESIKIHLMCIKFGTVDAGKLGSPPHPDAAGPAHPRTVDHDRIQAYVRPDPKRFCNAGRDLHHHRRADNPDAVDGPPADLGF